jgi:uncharacterized delta-60 repeat protein
MLSKTKISGVWRNAVIPYIKVSGTWKDAKAAFVKVDGEWKNWFLQGGVLDIPFSSAVTFDNNGTFRIAITSDQKILVGGSFSSVNGSFSNNFVRLNKNGTLDSTFNIGSGPNAIINSLNVAPDQKIVISGGFTSFNGVTTNRIVRLNSDGTRDSSFIIGTGFNNVVGESAIQQDGKVLVSGSFSQYNGASVLNFVRLNSDGTLDTAFNIGSGFNSGISSISVQLDGKIVVTGDFTSFNGVTTNRIVRLNSDGTRDNSFVIGTGFNNSVYAALQPDQKIIAVGFFTQYNGATSRRIVRLNADGTRDTSFNVGTGFDTFDQSRIPLVQANGKVVVLTGSSAYNGLSIGRIVRINSDGSLDTKFTQNIGSSTSGSANTSIVGMAEQGDNKIVVTGSFTVFNGVASRRIARISSAATPS